MADKLRLDAELVRRKIVDSRTKAIDLINKGNVYVDGFLATKPAKQVTNTQSIKLVEAQEKWASRGAYKLLGAVEYFQKTGLIVTDKICLDAGASTGGFTDVLLKFGAKKVYAVDVGYGQLVWNLQNDSRVVVKDKTNIRYLTAADLEDTVSLVVGDLSFISLTLVLDAFMATSSENADIIPMVKPQFEVGKNHLGKRGVVREPAYRLEAIIKVAKVAAEKGLLCKDVVESSLPGPAGNIEYFIWMKKGTGTTELSAKFIERAEKVVYEGKK